jgi:hypothetical protein
MDCHGLIQCRRGYFISKRQFLFTLFDLALLIDMVSTICFMSDFGEDGFRFEIHPLVSVAVFVYGPVLGTFLTVFLFKILGGFLLVRWLGRYSTLFLAASIATSSFAAVYNLWLSTFFCII